MVNQMKKLLLLTLLVSSGAWAEDSETIEYCKHKFEQVTMDIAMENSGCKFSSKTKEYMKQNLENTFLNCSNHLSDEDRNEIGQASAALSKVMFMKFGKDEACKSYASLYPKRIYD